MIDATPRVNNSKAKRLRARIRAKGLPCHVCGQPISYGAHHLDPLSFQVDHRWPVSRGGPEYDADNCAPSHRSCNRQRSDTIDQIAIDAAATYGVTLTAKTKAIDSNDRKCGPDGEPCRRCNGIHNGTYNGRTVTFMTTRTW
jgi:hypothetical protein